MRLIRTILVIAAAGIPALAWAQPVPVGPEFQVNTQPINPQRNPAAAMDGSGDFVVVWQSYGSGILGQRFDSAGAAVGGELEVTTTWEGWIYPAVAMNDSGAFVVAWESYGQDGSYWGVFGQRFDDTGAAAGSEFQVNTYTTGHQNYPAVALDSSGKFVVVWGSYEQDGSHFGVFGQRFDDTGAAAGSEFRVNTYTASAQDLPAVAMDPSGKFIVAWESFGRDGSAFGISAQRYNGTGTPLGGEFQINTYTDNWQFEPAVAVDGAGNFVVVWTTYDSRDADGGISGRRFNSAGTPLGDEFQVNTYTTGYQRHPAVAMDDSGNFVVVWESIGQDGSDSGVFGQAFGRTAVALGGEFQVNTYTTLGQDHPTVVMDDSGGFVAVWQSEGQDGDRGGIFAQQFACGDSDGDARCDLEEVIVASPVDGASLDCTDPRTTRPTITWSPGDYDRFRVFLSADPTFVDGAARVSSGDTLLRSTSWTPPAKKWRSACNKAVAADPIDPEIFVRVLGVDRHVPKSDPLRKMYSDVVQTDVQP